MFGVKPLAVQMFVYCHLVHNEKSKHITLHPTYKNILSGKETHSLLASFFDESMCSADINLDIKANSILTIHSSLLHFKCHKCLNIARLLFFTTRCKNINIPITSHHLKAPLCSLSASLCAGPATIHPQLFRLELMPPEMP